jgi:hypothetical protein
MCVCVEWHLVLKKMKKIERSPIPIQTVAFKETRPGIRIDKAVKSSVAKSLQTFPASSAEKFGR